jgi:hypothetical protein
MRLVAGPLVFALALVVVAATLVGAGASAAFARTASPTPSLYATPAPTPPPTPTAGERGALVKVGDDVTLAAGQTTDAVVVVGGDADVAGTVRSSVVVVGGDVRIRSTAFVGTEETKRDASVVVVGGKLITENGCTIRGTTQVVSLTAPRLDVGGAVWNLLAHPHISLVDWVQQTIFLAIVTLVVVALLGRQVGKVRDRALAEPLASLGWGALAAFLAAVAALILAATIIGLVVVVPALLLTPLAWLFVYAAGAFTVGDLLLGRIWPNRRNVYLSAITGVIVLTLVGMVPVLGGLANVAVWFAALGAVCWVLVGWRRTRAARRAALRPATPGIEGPAVDNEGNG